MFYNDLIFHIHSSPDITHVLKCSCTLYALVFLLFTPQLVGFARQLGCPKIVLDHMSMYVCIYICTTTMLKYTLYWRYNQLETH